MRALGLLALLPLALGVDGLRRGVLHPTDVVLSAQVGSRIEGVASGADTARIRTQARLLEVGIFEGPGILDRDLPPSPEPAPAAPEGCDARDHLRQGTVHWWVSACDEALVLQKQERGRVTRWPLEGNSDRAWLVRLDDIAAVATVEGSEVVLRQLAGIDPGRPGFKTWPLPGGLSLDVPVASPGRTGLVAIHRMEMDGAPVLGVARAGAELIVVSTRPVDGVLRLVVHRARVGGW